MGTLTHKAARAAYGTAIDAVLKHVKKDREKGLLELVDLTEKYMGDNFQKENYEAARKMIQDPDNKWVKYVNHMIDELDPYVIRQTALNLGYEAAFYGTKTIREMRKKYDCNIPWLILMDPTSACNLHCTGCWAAQYGNKLNLSFEDLDSIITQGKEMGVYVYLYSGGEPLVRKDDIIKLCEKHPDCQFTCFTNGTLIDEKFADDMLRVKNFIPAISVEGFEEDTDFRRGDGTFGKVEEAMRILKSKRLPFGISCCYTSKNYKTIGSEEYYDQMIAWGAKFCWFFTYMPVGIDAVPELMVTDEQREYMYHKVREFRKTKPLFTIDFWNDGEYVKGCIAGGRSYFHINANGDIEPCAFIHYSDSNIREKTLLEALQSPLFMCYHKEQPFCQNYLRPCPLLDNQHALENMVKESGAYSTDMAHPEDVSDLTAKCIPVADKWEQTANRIWAEDHPGEPLK